VNYGKVKVIGCLVFKEMLERKEKPIMRADETSLE
jgi:hypothetical protein